MSNSSNIVARLFASRPAAERRAGDDRRGHPTGFLSRYWLFGRRKAGRRKGERDNVYVDRYSPREWLLVLGVLVLSVLDMVFTLIHLDAGGAEANPIMAWTLERGGESLFRLVKLTTTIVGLLILLIHVRFKRVKGLLTFVFVLYFALFLFHLYLRFQGGG